MGDPQDISLIDFVSQAVDKACAPLLVEIERLQALITELVGALEEWVGAFYNAGPNAVTDTLGLVRASETALSHARSDHD